MFKYNVKRLSSVIRHVPQLNKIQEKCDRAVLGNDGKMCNKAVDNYAHALEFVPNCYKSQK